jgi:hypothetical protein
MKSRFIYLSAFMLALNAVEGYHSKNPFGCERNKFLKEIDDVCSWLKCSKKELYLKAKVNRKLLSKPSFMLLENMFGKEGGEE